MILPSYYDTTYAVLMQHPGGLGWEWMEERVAKIAPLVVGDSVLDLGCGLGIIADAIDNKKYFGVDFSSAAIQYANEQVVNPNATFQCGNIFDLLNMGTDKMFDTVLLLEVLEHVPKPKLLCDFAKTFVNQRLIVTVPRDMLGKAHLWPTWTKRKLAEMIGGPLSCELFGGEDSRRWWLGVRDFHEDSVHLE